MNKKIVLSGALIIIVGIIATIAVPIFTGLPTSHFNTTISSGGYEYLNFSLSKNTSIFLMVGNFTRPTNVYVFNTSAFDVWRTEMSNQSRAGGLHYAVQLEGRGTFAIYNNITEFVLPQNSYAASANALYQSNSSLTSGLGLDYVFVFSFEGRNGSSFATITYIPPTNLANTQQSKKIQDYISTMKLDGTLFISSLILGIILIMYGLLKRGGMPIVRPQQKAQNEDPEDIAERNRLYGNRINTKAGKRRKK